jgi:hypothetical protein
MTWSPPSYVRRHRESGSDGDARFDEVVPDPAPGQQRRLPREASRSCPSPPGATSPAAVRAESTAASLRLRTLRRGIEPPCEAFVYQWGYRARSGTPARQGYTRG